MNELWKAIPGYEGFYEVSSLGRVKSLARKCNHPFRKNLKEKILKNRMSSGGHVAVVLCDDKHRVYGPVHRLVLQAFVGPCPPNMECCHNNGIPDDNRVENLRWDTRRSNHLDRMKHGVWVQNKVIPCLGEAARHSKLKNEDVRRIREAALFGARKSDLSRAYEIKQSHIIDIIKRRAWRHI
jgi:hypothetical protein